VRIGIDIAKALGRPDGIGSYTAGLVRALMAADRENAYRLYPLVEAASPEEFARRFPEAPPNFAFRCERRPAPGEVDVFHATAYGVPADLAAPLVFTVHDLSFLTHPHCHTLDNRIHCLTGLARGLARGAKLLAVSQSTRREAIRLLAVGESDVAVVYQAVDERFRPQKDAAVEQALARHGLGRPYVFTVGVLEPRKNLRHLIEAFRRLPAQVRESHLLVVAGAAGWLAEDPRRLAEEAGVAAQVRLLGEVPAEDLPALYAGAAVLAYPSLYEGFGLPPLEAMACGTPVVASNGSSLPEVVGEAGVLVDPHEPDSIRDGLVSVLTDPARRQALCAAGLARAAAFTWERAARETLALYGRAAAGAGG